MNARLGKSLVRDGARCQKLVWWRLHEPAAPELALTALDEVRIAQARAVAERARAYVPGARFEVTLVDPKFDVEVKADLLAPMPDGTVSIIDVVAATRVRSSHITDLALLMHVARAAGEPVAYAEVMHLNPSAAYPDLRGLFVREDVTDEVVALLPQIPKRLLELRAVEAGPLPEVATGPQCERPRTCVFVGRCFARDAFEHEVQSLHRYSEVADALDPGWKEIADIPDGFELPAVAARQRRAVVEKRRIVEPTLRAALERLRRPLAFLDFETIGLPIPVWKGVHPFESVPVQFAVHIEKGAGKGDGHERYLYLADGPDDPRPTVARALLAATAGAKTVLAYHADFERKCIDSLIAGVPELADALRGLRARIDDLLPVVRDHVYDPAFKGSFGLKTVAPVLVPEVSYDALAIRDGEEATRALERLLFDRSMPAEARATLRASLHTYCELDSWVMVRLLERLRALAADNPPS